MMPRMWRRTWLAMAIVAIGCASSNSEHSMKHEPPEPVIATEPTTPSPVAVLPTTPPVDLRETEIGRSVKGTPMMLRTFGSGPATIFIMGGIHGDETTSVDLTTNLIVLLEKNLELAP